MIQLLKKPVMLSLEQDVLTSDLESAGEYSVFNVDRSQRD